MIVTDVRLYREGLGQMLLHRPTIEVVGTVSPSDATLELMAASRPDIVLMDSGTVTRTDACRLVSTLVAPARVVAFAVSEDDDHEILACAQAGVCGFVGREASVDDLVDVITTASKEHARCSPRITAALIRGVAALGAAPIQRVEHPTLTLRERQVLQCIDGAMSNKEIANHLGISAITVKNHVHNILTKLSLHRRAQAAALMRSEYTPTAPRLPEREI